MNRLLAPPSHRSATSPAATLVLQPVRQPAIAPKLLSPGRVQIGSDSGSELCLRLPGVAERHAVVVVTPQGALVQAVDPRTWVNDWPIKETKLRIGDRLAIGPVMFQVRAATTDEILQQLPASAETTVSGEPVAERTQELPTVEPEDPAPWIPAEEHLVAPSTELLGEWLSAAESTDVDPHGIEQQPWFLDVWSLPVADAEVDATNRRRAEEAAEFQAKVQEERAAWDQEQLERERQRADWDRERHTWEEQRETWEQNLRAEGERLAAWDQQRREHDEERARWEQEQTEQNERRAAWSLEREERIRQFDERDQALARRAEQLDQLQQELQRRHDEQVDYVARWKLQQEEWQKRQADLLDLQQRLRTEREQLEQVVGQVRAELSAESATQSATWGEWQTVHARLTAELTNQFSEAETRRTELSARAAAFEAEQSTLLVARAQLDADRDALTEERRRWVEARHTIDADTAALRDDLRRQEGQFVSAVHDRAQSQAEFLSARRELQHERQLFAVQQTAWLQERESLWNDLSERRRQLEQEFGALERQHLQLGRLVIALEQELSGVNFEREDLKTERLRLQAERDALTETRAELCDAQSHYDESSQDYDADHADWQEELRAEQAQLVADRQEYEQSHAELLAAHQELQRERRRIAEEREEWIQERDAECEELAAVQQQLDDQIAAAEAQHAELDRLRESLQREFATVAQEREQLRALKQQLESAPPQPLVTAIASDSSIAAPADPVAESSVAPEALVLADDPTEDVLPAVTGTEAQPQPQRFDVDERSAVQTPGDETSLIGSPSATSQVEIADDRIPSSLTIESRGGGSAEKPIDDSVNSLREELARLFNLPEDSNETGLPGTDSEGLEAAAYKATGRDRNAKSAADLRPSNDDSIEWRDRLQALLEPSSVQADAMFVDAPFDDANVPADNSAAEPPKEEESISSFMDQLMARTQKNSMSPRSEAAGLLPRTSEEVWFRNAVDRRLESPKSFVESPEVNRPTVEVADPFDFSYLDAAPAHAQDRDEVRANLQSFRHVANLSARTALKKHGWRTMRSEIVGQAILASVCAAGAAAYFGGPAWGGPVQLLPGSACLIVATWTFSQWCLSMRYFKRWKPNQQSAPKAKPADIPTEVTINDEPTLEQPTEIECSTAVEPAAVDVTFIEPATHTPEFAATSPVE